MVKKLVCIFLCSFFSLSMGRKAPPEVSALLKSEAMQFIKNAFDNGYESSLGFSKEDKIENIAISEPFKLNQINFDKAKSFAKDSDIKNLADEIPDWYALVLLNDDAKDLVSITQINGQWKFKAITPDDRAPALHIIFKKHNINKSIIFFDPQSGSIYLHDPTVNKANLTLINTNKLAKLNKKFKSQQLIDSIDVLNNDATEVNIYYQKCLKRQQRQKTHRSDDNISGN